VTDDGYLPSVFPALAAIAARTTTVRLGTAVLLAPFHHPLRLAEDAAFVDQLSGGRVELGLGLGYRSHEFAALGVPRAERATRTEELIEIVRCAWSGERFSHRGRHWSFDDVDVTPPPYQPGGPRLWLGGTSVAAAKRAGRLGCHFVPDAYIPVDRYAVYRAALAEAGHDPAAFGVAINPTIYVCEDPVAGWDEVKEHFLYAHNLYRRWAAADEREARVIADPDDLPRDRYIVGTPEAVIAELESLRERHGCERVFFWARPPGLPAEASMRSLELFAEHVLPYFSASPPA
jgi:alkanesulfonate monooxygenase SsuD/methylene tetrahydromethanopterin reductase-like flavin-dependent oxidoreductase (luciferase family)